MKGPGKKLILKLVGGILLPFFLATGCISSGTGPNTGTEGGDPAAPPVPPAELPSFLRFPETISEISVSALTKSGETTAALSIGDDVSGSITSTALNTVFVYDFVDDILGPLHELIIPVSQNNNHFEDIIVIGTNLINVKIDFSDFEGRGCSGHTAALPICYRIWLDGERSLFGQFDAFPTEENAGIGSLTGTPSIALFGDAPIPVTLQYDFQDPLTKFVDIAIEFLSGEVGTPPRFSRVVLDQVPIGNSLLKTIRSTRDGSFEGLTESASRWIDEEDLWSAKGRSESGVNNEAFCASISAGLVVERENCIALGIDVENLEFALLPDPFEFAFPPDFPIVPTF